MITFELQGREYIELNKLLKVLGWVGTGGEANHFIERGMVAVNQAVETRKRKKLRAGDTVVFEEHTAQIQ